MVFWTFSKFWKNRNNLETFFFKIFKKTKIVVFVWFFGPFFWPFFGVISKLFRFLGNFEKRRFVDFLKILKKNRKTQVITQNRSSTQKVIGDKK